jgi:DNA primase
VPDIQKPTVLAFDLDPGEGSSVLACAQVAFLIHDLFERVRMKALAKVSGSKGIQLYIPLNTPVTYDQTQAFARTPSYPRPLRGKNSNPRRNSAHKRRFPTASTPAEP